MNACCRCLDKVARPFVESMRRFWTAPAAPQPLAWFRIGLAGVLLAQALSLIGHMNELYGRHGIVAWSARWEQPLPGVPDLSWLESALGLVGVSAGAAVPLTVAVYAGCLVGLLLGYHTRLAAVAAWLTHTALVNSSYMSCYGADSFAQIGLFYCCWFPVGQALSLDRAAGRLPTSDVSLAFQSRLGLRVLQLHVCIIYTSSGLEKALGQQWWTGEAVWRAVMGAPLEGPFDCSFLATVPWLAKALCWMTLLLEAGVVLFVWQPCLRKLWLVGIVGMHLGIALVLGLWTFSATMIVFDIAAFGFSPRKATARIVKTNLAY